MNVLSFFVVFGAGLLAGGLVAVTRGQVPTMDFFEHKPSIQLHRLFFEKMHTYMKPMGILTTVLGVAIVIMGRDDLAATILTAVGVAAMVGLIADTEILMSPVNKAVLAGSFDDAPDDYAVARERWGRAQITRTVCSIAAFGCFLAALIVR